MLPCVEHAAQRKALQQMQPPQGDGAASVWLPRDSRVEPAARSQDSASSCHPEEAADGQHQHLCQPYAVARNALRLLRGHGVQGAVMPRP